MTIKTPAALFFDLDGTLIDTAPDFIRCLNTIRKRYGLKHLPEPEIRQSVSDGARAMVRIGFGLSPDDDDYFERHSEFLDLYESEVAVDTCLFAGMDKVLHWLESRHIPWGIVTNKPRRFAAPLLKALDLYDRCDALVCPDDVEKKKPDPEALHLAAKISGAKSCDCIYVGDHVRDIEAGQRAEMTTIAARYGYIANPSSIEHWEADEIIDSAYDLLKILENGAAS